MARSKMQKCSSCGTYTLDTTCKECGSPAEAAAPLKFSPEDPQATRRRKFLKVTEKEWAESLPSPKKEVDE